MDWSVGVAGTVLVSKIIMSHCTNYVTLLNRLMFVGGTIQNSTRKSLLIKLGLLDTVV